jgi:spore coat polysaccharide biosynthesis protein SpsF
MSSARLPSKALRDVGGRPLLARVIDRLRIAADNLDCAMIVATSTEADDDAIADLATTEHAEIYRGPLDDVAARTLAAARTFGLDTIVRISGDSPFISPSVIATAVNISKSDVPDLTTNVYPRTFPRGMSVEVIKTETLRKILEAPVSDLEREHVTKAFYDRPDDFSITNFTSPHGDLSAINLTVDTANDLEKARWIVGKLGNRTATAPLGEIVGLARDFETVASV